MIHIHQHTYIMLICVHFHNNIHWTKTRIPKPHEEGSHEQTLQIRHCRWIRSDAYRFCCLFPHVATNEEGRTKVMADFLRKTRIPAAVLVCALCVLPSACSSTQNQSDDDKLTMPETSSNFEGEHYEDVVTRLESSGFTNITTRKQEDLITGWLTEYLTCWGPGLLRLGAIMSFGGYCVSRPGLLRLGAVVG